MTSEEIKNEIEYYEEIVMKKPISNDMKGHLIEGFGVTPTPDGQYDLYVIGENLTHAIPLIKKPLEEWLKDNGY